MDRVLMHTPTHREQRSQRPVASSYSLSWCGRGAQHREAPLFVGQTHEEGGRRHHKEGKRSVFFLCLFALTTHTTGNLCLPSFPTQSQSHYLLTHFPSFALFALLRLLPFLLLCRSCCCRRRLCTRRHAACGLISQTTTRLGHRRGGHHRPLPHSSAPASCWCGAPPPSWWPCPRSPPAPP